MRGAAVQHLLDDGLAGVGHAGAGSGRNGSVKEGGDVVVGAGFVRGQVGDLVDAYVGDAVRFGELVDIGVLRELDGALHELGPDGGGGEGSLELDVGVVVVADPDDADEVGSVAGEPGVVGGTGLTGGGCGEAVGANGRGGAASDDTLQQRLGEVGDAGVEDLAGDRGVVGDDVSAAVADAGEHPGVEADAVVREDGIGAGHVDGRGLIGADGD